MPVLVEALGSSLTHVRFIGLGQELDVPVP